MGQGRSAHSDAGETHHKIDHAIAPVEAVAEFGQLAPRVA